MNLLVRLKREELIYDISNVAFITGDMMLSDVKLQSIVQDVANEGNVDKISRSLTRIHNELINALTAYTKVDTLEDIVVSDDLDIPEYYEISLTVPQTFSAPNAKSVMTAAHDYMVNMSLYEWFCITKKDESSVYEEKALKELRNIKSYMSKRTTSLRIKKRPW